MGSSLLFSRQHYFSCTLEGGLQTAFTERAAYNNAQRRSFWLSTTLTLLLAGGFGGLIGRRLARPLDRVAAAADRIAHGDLHARAAVAARGDSQAVTALLRNFNMMAEGLERLEEERKATLNDVAHDLKTPLTVIQGRLDAFADGIRPLTLDNVMACQHSLDILTRLVKDLRTLALAEGGHLTLEREQVDLTMLARDIVADFEDRAQQKGVGLEFRAPQTPPYLNADPARLAQIVYNLLDNALKYTPDGGRVTLHVLSNQGDVQLIVRDSGKGLGEADIKRVMNRFYRVDAVKEATSELGASGLGLAIVNALATMHGGRVEVSNAEEGGAEFRVALPGPLAG